MATAVGVILAVATAYNVIDWKNFDIKTEWPKLVCTGTIAVFGYITEIKAKK